jgi:hypothetical protein
VANLLVMMEFYGGALLPVSLEVLGQARRLGSALGMTVYALVPLPPEPAEDEDITVRCGRFGADKVLLLTGDSLFSESEMRFEQYSDALIAACTTLPPRLLLMGDTPSARDILPRLAARLGAAYLPRGAALAVDGHLVLCDPSGRHLRIPLEAATSEGIPPLTVPVMMTVPAGRHEMAWGDQDAELMIVPPQEDSAQTIPNLAVSRIVRGGFVEETIEAQPLLERVSFSTQPTSAKVPPLWRVGLGKLDGANAMVSPFFIHIGPGASSDPTANYHLKLPEAELSKAAATLGQLLAAKTQVPQIENPGPRPPPSREFEGFEDSTELTPTGEPWDDDYGGDTLGGSEASSARIRAIVSEATAAPPALSIPPISSAATPPVGVAGTPLSQLRFTPLSAPPQGNAGAAMWEGFATMPDDEDVPLDEDGNPLYDEAHADTAPVPIVSPRRPLDKPKGSK